MTPEPLNTFLVIVFVLSIALFMLAWVVLLGGAGAFVVLSVRFRDLQATSGATPQQQRAAREALRSGRWGLLMCSVTLAAYFLRQWAGTIYGAEIARGLVAHSGAWWIVFPLSVLWWGSIPLGIAGTILTSRAGLHLNGLMKQMPPACSATSPRRAETSDAPRVISVRVPERLLAAVDSARWKERIRMLKPARVFAGFGVACLQLVAALIVTFAFSMVVPDMNPDKNHGLFVASAGLAFSLGIGAAGALALALGWLKSAPSYLRRIALTALGAYVPLVAALGIGQMTEGSPYFLVSMLLGILGFHVGGWTTAE